MTSVRVLLAEDHRLVRAGIHALLDRMAGVEVVGEVSDGVEALKVVEAIQPDLVLMDVAMPGIERTGSGQPHFQTVAGGPDHHAFHARE